MSSYTDNLNNIKQFNEMCTVEEEKQKSNSLSDFLENQKIFIKKDDTKYLRDNVMGKRSDYKTRMVSKETKGIGKEKVDKLLDEIFKINDINILKEICDIFQNEIKKRKSTNLERTKTEEGNDLTNELSEDEQVELNNIIENGDRLSDNLIDSLNCLYSGTESDVDFIRYTGQVPKSCNNKSTIFTVKEFEDCMYEFFSEEIQDEIIYYDYKWYHFVVLAGANVYWNV